MKIERIQEWIDLSKKLHEQLILYIDCVEKHVEFGEYDTAEEENLLKYLNRLKQLEDE